MSLKVGNAAFKKLFPILGLLVLASLLVLFQNCSFEDDSGFKPNNSIIAVEPTKGNFEDSGNGGGYTGKLTVIAPSIVDQGERYTITIEGGVPPYKISSPQGQINVINSDGTQYELENDFGQTVQSFEVIVTDAEGSQAKVSIDIVATDNVFNFSFVASSMLSGNDYLLYDDNMNKIIVFDENGFPKELLSPHGRLMESFQSEMVLIREYQGVYYVLDSPAKTIHKYDNRYKYLSSIDFSAFAEIIEVRSIAIVNDRIFLVDVASKNIKSFDLYGQDLRLLDLDTGGLPLDDLAAISFDPVVSSRIFVSDKVLKEILVFEDLKLVDRISSLTLEDGSNHSFLGVTAIHQATNGSLFISDSIYKSGDYKSPINGNHGEEWNFKFDYQPGLANQNAEQFSFRYLTSYYEHARCLSVSGDLVSYCDEKKQLKVKKTDGTFVTHIYSRLGGFGTGVSEPRRVTVDDQGNYFLSSDYGKLVGISADQQIMYRLSTYGPNNENFNYILGLEVVDDKLFVGMRGYNNIIVLDKMTGSYLYEIDVFDDQDNALPVTSMSRSKDHLIVFNYPMGIGVYDFQGNLVKFINEFVPGESDYPEDDIWIKAMDVSKGNILYFYDHKRKKIYRYDIFGESLGKSLNVGKQATEAIAVDEFDRVYVNFENTIHVYEGATWKKLTEFGASGITPGTFNGIHGLEVRDNYVYVSDRYNQRVQRISGTLFQ